MCTASSAANARARASRADDLRMRAQRLDDLVADRHHRVQRELRILQHHRDAPAAQLAPLPRAEQRRRSMPLNSSRCAETRPSGAVRPRMARPVCVLPEPDSPTMPRRSRPSVNETPRTASVVPPSRFGKRHAKVVDDQHRRRRCGCRRIHFAAFGSSASRRPSPSRLNARLTMKIAAPGAAATHHWSST